ncbi:hypothetical protein GCM10009795_005460 [Nocardioides hankookensis]|uniref:Uncharacterized protein n=1 Tax=Nocardioides hankookensis TaxID=443157 RepID=A0ABW1LGB2_9ACTN
MLTDDDLTRQLGGAFRDGARDHQYAGRIPAPRPTAAPVGIPLALSAAVVAALAAVWVSAPEAAETASRTAGDRSAFMAPGTATPSPELTTDTIEVAGFIFSYRHPAAESVDDVLHVFVPSGVPDGSRPVEVPAPAKAWVGTNPRSGEVAIYLQAPSRFGGKLFGVSSPGLSEAQMITFLRTGVS